MDFLRNHGHLEGGDTRKTPNLANHDIRQEGKTPPHANPFQSSKSRRSLKIRQTARPPPAENRLPDYMSPVPLNPFQPKYPMG